MIFGNTPETAFVKAIEAAMDAYQWEAGRYEIADPEMGAKAWNANTRLAARYLASLRKRYAGRPQR